MTDAITTTDPGKVLTGGLSKNVAMSRDAMTGQVLESVGLYLRTVVMRKQFESEGGYLGNRWKSTSDEYNQAKAEIYNIRSIGVATGAMRDAYTSREMSQKTTETSKAIPILVTKKDTVSVGGTAIEIRRKTKKARTKKQYNKRYSYIFDAFRKVWTNTLPKEDSDNIATAFLAPYLAACRKSDAAVTDKPGVIR